VGVCVSCSSALVVLMADSEVGANEAGGVT
jgi:hypothetical protein